MVSPLLRRKNIDLAFYNVKAHVAVVRCPELSIGNTFLGSDEDDTVGTPCSIYLRGSTVFQDRYRLDVVFVYVLKVASGDAVDDY